MKKLLAILALAVLLVPGIVLAQPPAGCTWDGDPCIREGWSGTPGAGIDYRNISAGQTLSFNIRVQNAFKYPDWPGSCNLANGIPDTFCTQYSVRQGATVINLFGWDVPYEMGSGSAMYQTVRVTGKCSASIGDKDTIIVKMVYTRTDNADCAPLCGDCMDPNIRGTGKLYQADTLIITYVAATSDPITITQAALTEVEFGQTQAYIPFGIGNANACFPGFAYSIKSKGHIGAALDTTAALSIAGGTVATVYGIVDAGTAAVCTYDTLKIKVWTTSGPLWYDSCVQRIHVTDPVSVPLFTVPVVTILVLALILAAAVFMRRRAVSRA